MEERQINLQFPNFPNTSEATMPNNDSMTLTDIFNKSKVKCINCGGTMIEDECVGCNDKIIQL